MLSSGILWRGRTLFGSTAQLLPLLILLWAIVAQGRAQAPEVWQAKVDPWVLDTAAESGETEFIVLLTEQAHLANALAIADRAQRATYVVERLQQTARESHRPLLTTLDQMGVDYRSYWIVNMVWVRGDADAVRQLAGRSDVAHIYANPQVPMHLPPGRGAENASQPRTVEWNIVRVRAPEVWAEGVSGAGIVVGGQDTGYDWQHPALINQYRGWDGSQADHNYNWHDAVHEGGSICGADSAVPCDDNGHGTHTLGTMVGDDGGANQIGMAPDARWIGCRNMDNGIGTPATYTECFEWFMAPTDLNGENPDVSKAPHVINNSWSCPQWEGCEDVAVLQTVVENVQAAGIVVVAAAGNSGDSCSSVASPPAIYEASFSIGATDANDLIAPFSARGPVTIDGSNRIKPDVVAPGMRIRSTLPGGGYGFSQGTSMASPHVAGLVALLLSANPALVGDVDAVKALIAGTARPLTSEESCGSVPGDAVPNNTYGAGLIDALAAYEETTAPPVDERLRKWYFPLMSDGVVEP